MAAPADPAARRALIVRALKKQRQRLSRKLEALRGDLAEAERATLYRRYGEALLAYLGQVPARSARVKLPDPAVGDLVAVAATGAYCFTMSNSYNGARRIHVVFAREGRSRLVVRRDTWDDLLAREVI